MRVPALTGFRAFILILIGQTASLTGTGLSAFALGLWMLKETGSVTLYTLMLLCVTLPGALLSPIAGTVADRWDRRRLMLVSDTISGLGSTILAILFFTDSISVWHVYLISTLNSAANAFQYPAFEASVTMLVPREQWGRANGLIRLSSSTSELLAPAISATLYALISIEAIIMLDLVTFFLAVTATFFTKIPKPTAAADGEEAGQSFFRQTLLGWNYLLQRPGLLGLQAYTGAMIFLFNVADAIMYPLVLTVTTQQMTGVLASLNGLGMLLGSLLMSTWGGLKRRVLGTVLAGAGMGLGVTLSGVRPNVVLVAIGMASWFFFFPQMGSMAGAIWHMKVAPEIQGRVFALRRMVQLLMMSLAFTLSGPLTDQVFTPMMREGGRLAAVFGPFIGVGEGRGHALLYVFVGFGMLGASALAYLHPRLRRLEEELPDAAVDVETAS